MEEDTSSTQKNSVDTSKIPFFSILSPSDQFQYQELYRRLSSDDKRYNRNKRIETFQETLEEIKKYCIRNTEDDWKRFLVCGICWIDDSICTNIRQLRILLGKSKSSINGAFQKMSYETIPPKGNDAIPLLKIIPFLQNNFAEERQWSIRRPPSHSNAIFQYNNTSLNNHQHEACCCHSNKSSNKSNEVNIPIIRKPCAFGCTCGCDCKINGEAEHPCRCIYPDDSYEYGKDVCHCEKIAGIGQIQPIIIDDSIESKS